MNWRLSAIAIGALALGVTATAPVALAGNGKHWKKKPNIIIYMIDDLGQDATELYNKKTEDPNFPLNAPMPSLEKFAKQGVTFTNAWAMPVCSTTRAARTTGQYATVTGVGQVIGAFTPRFGAPGSRFDGVEFPPSILNPNDPKLLQKLLRKAGYRTLKYGKYHEHELDYDAFPDFDPGGFNAPGDQLDLDSEAAGLLAVEAVKEVDLSGFDEFYGLWSGVYGGINANGYGGGELPGSGGTTSDSIILLDSEQGGDDARNPTNEFADSALMSRAIRQIRQAKKDGVPYFAEISVIGPHFEYEVPPGPWDAQPTDYAGEPGEWLTLDKTIHKALIAQIIVAYNVDSEAEALDPAASLFEIDASDALGEYDAGFIGMSVADAAAKIAGDLDAYQSLYPPVGTRPAFPPPGSDLYLLQARAAFKGLVAYLDLQFGRLMKHVDLKDTYVVFVGDNGTQGGARFGVIEDPNDINRSKATVYRNGVEVPFVFSGPGIKRKMKGAWPKDAVNVTDLFAMSLDVAGVRQPRDTRRSSYSFARVLKGGRSWRRYNVAEMFAATGTVGGTAVGVGNFPGSGRVVSDGRYRLLAFDRLDADGAFVCLPGANVLPAEDCRDDKGRYRKVVDLEFYDTKFDEFEEDALVMGEMKRFQKKAFFRHCLEMNRVSKRAVYYQNGKICQLDGGNLTNSDLETVETASAP